MHPQSEFGDNWVGVYVGEPARSIEVIEPPEKKKKRKKRKHAVPFGFARALVEQEQPFDEYGPEELQFSDYGYP